MRSLCMIAILVMGMVDAVLGEPHFDGFIRAEARGNRLDLFDVRIVGGTPGECIPEFIFTNLTTGIEGEFLLCCDYYFKESGSYIVLHWIISDGAEFVSADGDLDELSLRDCEHVPIDVQPGIWRETGEPGLFVREAVSTPTAATTWGQIKARYEGNQ